MQAGLVHIARRMEACLAVRLSGPPHHPPDSKDFVRTKLGRNKTDGIDALRIREYCELFKALAMGAAF